MFNPESVINTGTGYKVLFYTGCTDRNRPYFGRTNIP